MIRENEIKDVIQKYLAGGSLDRFEEWLAERSWNMHRDSEPDVQRLVGGIQMLIAEHGYGNISEASLRQQLCDLISIPVASFRPIDPDSETVTFVSNSTVQIPLFGMQVSTVSSS